MGFQFVTSGLGGENNETLLCPQCGKVTVTESPRQKEPQTERVDRSAAAWVSVREDGESGTL